MNIQIFRTEKQLDKHAARMLAHTIRTVNRPVLGLATGGTPVGTYKALIELYNEENFSFKNTRTANLDEYVGLSREHPQSYYHYMSENLFSHVDLPQENAYIPDGTVTDLEAECQRYDEVLDSFGRIDLQILGIGTNGHIGFNEPDSSLRNGTHTVELSQATIDANARFFDSADEVPKQAITVGVGPILRAKEVLLLAKGEEKADILEQALRGPITTECPASLLQLHPNVHILVDEAAGRKLK